MLTRKYSLTMNVQIRPAKYEEMNAVNQMHVQSIRDLCSKDYRPEQIAAWSAVVYKEKNWHKSINEDFYRVLEIDGEIHGFCHATLHPDQSGEILGLYVSKNARGKGLGEKIFNKALEYLLSKNPSKLVISSTKTAKDFYQRMGFSVVGEMQTHDIRGVGIECFCMEKVLV